MFANNEAPKGTGGFDWKGLAGAVSPFLGSLFGQAAGDNYKNPYAPAQQAIGQIPGAVQPYFQPYIQAGQGALGTLQGQYGNLLSNPGQLMNQIGSSYQQSPGYDFKLKQALDAAGHAAAAGGLAGSPQHQQQNMELATQLANQDYNNWLSNALGLYGQGLSGTQGLAQGGLQAGGSLANSLANALSTQAELGFKGTQAENERGAKQSGMWNTIGNIAGAAAPFLFGLL